MVGYGTPNAAKIQLCELSVDETQWAKMAQSLLTASVPSPSALLDEPEGATAGGVFGPSVAPSRSAGAPEHILDSAKKTSN